MCCLKIQLYSFWHIKGQGKSYGNEKVIIEFFSIEMFVLTLLEVKIAKFANRVDLDEVALNEPPHLDLHCLPSSL